eukprot:11158954-Lingulodinium_polyedra.AAC.1
MRPALQAAAASASQRVSCRSTTASAATAPSTTFLASTCGVLALTAQRAFQETTSPGTPRPSFRVACRRWPKVAPSSSPAQVAPLGGGA